MPHIHYTIDRAGFSVPKAPGIPKPKAPKPPTPPSAKPPSIPKPPSAPTPPAAAEEPKKKPSVGVTAAAHLNKGIEKATRGVGVLQRGAEWAARVKAEHSNDAGIKSSGRHYHLNLDKMLRFRGSKDAKRKVDWPGGNPRSGFKAKLKGYAKA